MCHVYDWHQQKELSVITGLNVDVAFPYKATQMCSEGKFITKLKVFSDWSGGISEDQPGSIRMQFKCENPLAYGSEEQQELKYGSYGGGIQYSGFVGAQGRFLCGIQDAWVGEEKQCLLGICGGDEAGLLQFSGVFCEYNCQGFLNQTQVIESKTFQVIPPESADPYASGTRDYWQTSQKVGKFSDYFYHGSLDGQCSIDLCEVSSNQGSTDNIKIGQPLDDLVSGDVNLYEANTDPQQLFTQEFFFQCQVSNQIFPNQATQFQSTTFSVTLECPSNIEIFEPSNLESTQTRDASHVTSSYPYFEFGSYQTKTKACVVKQYLVSAHEEEGVVPQGVIDSNTYTEPFVSGIVNENTYVINIENGLNPTFYDFRIKVQSMEGNWQWFPSNTDSSIKYRLISKCPDTVEIFPLTTYNTFFQSFLGATGEKAVYEFVQFTTNLPMCQQILNFQITAEGLNYPSASCMTDPCTIADIDTSSTREFTFNFVIVTSIDAGISSTSEEITIRITETEETPTISAPMISDAIYILDSDATFNFERFKCSTGCQIDYYLISSTNSETEIPPISQGVSGLGAISDMSFSIDTSDVSTIYSFYIFSRLKLTESQYIFSNHVTISIECGSETISMLKASYSHQVLQPSAGQYEFNSDYVGKFSSSTSQCPLVGYQSPTISTYLSLFSNQTIKILLQPFRETIQVYANTDKVQSSPMQIEFTVCGHEVVTADQQINVITIQQEEEVIITKETYVQYFETNFYSTNSHQDCTLLNYKNLFLGEDCQDSASAYFSFEGDDIVIKISTPGTFILCLQAETVGYVKASKFMKIQVCGDEKILVENDILKLGINPSDPMPIDLPLELQFISTRQECPVTTYELSGYEGNQLLLSEDGSKLQVLTNDSFTSDGIYLKASSKSGSFLMVPIDIQVCGYEKVELKLKKNKLEIVTLDKNQNWEIKYEGYFESNNTEYCPINRYTLEQINPYNSTLPSWFTFQNSHNLIIIYPKQFTFQPTEDEFSDDEQFIFSLKAWTIGNQTQSYEIDITIIDSKKQDGISKFLDNANYTNQIPFDLILAQWSEGECGSRKWRKVEFAETRVTDFTPGDRVELYEDLFQSRVFSYDLPFQNETGDPVQVLRGIVNADKYSKLLDSYRTRKKKMESIDWVIENLPFDCVLYIEGVTMNGESTDCRGSQAVNAFLKVSNITTIKKVEKQKSILEQPSVSSLNYYNTSFDVQFSEPMKQYDHEFLCKSLTLSTISVSDLTEYVGSCNSNSTRLLQEKNKNLAEKMLKFTWKVEKQLNQSITISVNFTTPQYVSQGIHGIKDLLKVKVSQLVNLNDVPMTPSDHYIDLPPILGEIDAQIQAIQSIAISTAIVACFSAIITSKAKQDMWGMLSVQQIFIYMIILKQSATVPQPMLQFNQFVSNLFQEDMYPMDWINEKLHFQFSSTESPIEQFEELGFEGSNFIELTGSYYINVGICIVCIFANKFVNHIVTKFYKQRFMRIIGMQVEKTNILYGILNFYFQMYLDLFFCSLLSLYGGIYFENRSDLISFIFLIKTFLMIMILLIVIAYILNTNFGNLQDQKIQEKFGFAYEELNLNRKVTAFFNVFFLLRRCVFAIILLFMNDHGGLQLIVFFFKTFFFCLYLMIYKPFETRESNNYQVINEICIMLSTYVLFIMSDINLVGTEYRATFSYLYIFFNLTSIFFNVHQVFNKWIFIEIPLRYKKFKIQKQRKNYYLLQQQYLKQKELRAEVFPENKDAQLAVELMKLTLQLREEKEKFNEDIADFGKHLRWLQNNDLPTVILEPIRKKLLGDQKRITRHQDRLRQLDAKHSIRLGAQVNHVNSLKCSELILRSQPAVVFPHLDPQYHHGFEPMPLYNHSDMPSLLISSETLSKHQKQDLRDQILQYKQRKLDHFLRNYTMHNELTDGDQALAMALCQDKDKNRYVRRQICQYILVNHEYWAEKAHNKDIQFYVEDHLRYMGKFDDLVIFEAAAKLFDRPIILFSSLNETPFLDKVCNALTYEGNKVDPIYLYVDHKYNYAMLAHPKNTFTDFIPYQTWPRSILNKEKQRLNESTDKQISSRKNRRKVSKSPKKVLKNLSKSPRKVLKNKSNSPRKVLKNKSNSPNKRKKSSKSPTKIGRSQNYSPPKIVLKCAKKKKKLKKLKKIPKKKLDTIQEEQPGQLSD